MRIILGVIVVSVILSCSLSYAQSPPFQKVTINGMVNARFNKVSLFESGSSKTPLKTEYISNGTYRIDVNIPSDMKEKGDYLYTDMRFWGDNNNNGMRDPGEPVSQCHFIIWVPSANMIYLQVYKGPRYKFESSGMEYNYQ